MLKKETYKISAGEVSTQINRHTVQNHCSED